jgi:hypothetical protein
MILSRQSLEETDEKPLKTIAMVVGVPGWIRT